MKKYRLEIRPALELSDGWKLFLFDTLRELRAGHNTAADLLLYLHEKGMMGDYSNVFICERWEIDNDEWIEIDDLDAAIVYEDERERTAQLAKLSKTLGQPILSATQKTPYKGPFVEGARPEGSDAEERALASLLVQGEQPKNESYDIPTQIVDSIEVIKGPILPLQIEKLNMRLPLHGFPVGIISAVQGQETSGKSIIGRDFDVVKDHLSKDHLSKGDVANQLILDDESFRKMMDDNAKCLADGEKLFAEGRRLLDETPELTDPNTPENPIVKVSNEGVTVCGTKTGLEGPSVHLLQSIIEKEERYSAHLAKVNGLYDDLEKLGAPPIDRSHLGETSLDEYKVFGQVPTPPNLDRVDDVTTEDGEDSTHTIHLRMALESAESYRLRKVIEGMSSFGKSVGEIRDEDEQNSPCPNTEKEE